MVEQGSAPVVENAYVLQARKAYNLLRVSAVCLAIGVAGLVGMVGIDVATWKDPHHSTTLQNVQHDTWLWGTILTVLGLTGGAVAYADMETYEKRHGIEVGRFERSISRTGGLSTL
jgi:hypothetical protein